MSHACNIACEFLLVIIKRNHMYFQLSFTPSYCHSPWTSLMRRMCSYFDGLSPSISQNSCSHFVPCLPAICYCCKLLASHWHRKVTWLKDKLTTYPVLFCVFWMFCMKFANLKKFYKAVQRIHLIKGQYELLCLKYLVSELITGQSFLDLCMSSLWFLWLTVKNAANVTIFLVIILIFWNSIVHHPYTTSL